MNLRYILFFTFLFIQQISSAQENPLRSDLDSISYYRNIILNDKLPIDERQESAKKIKALSLRTQIDTTIMSTNRILSAFYLDQDDYKEFREINHENLKLGSKLSDSITIAISNHNLGWYHHVEIHNDSAYYYYYNAAKIYDGLKQIRNEGEVLLNMADIQETERDFVGSEVNAIRAVSLIQTLPENQHNLDTLWSLHNLLGVISEKLGFYENAINYHEKAIGISNKLTDSYIYNLFSRINLALSYRKVGKYDLTIKYFEELLLDSKLKKEEPNTYALILNNLAYTKFLIKDDDRDKIEELFAESFKISDSINDPIVKMAASNSMAEFYMSSNDMSLARNFAKQAYQLGRETGNNDEVLTSLKLLSDIDKGDIGNKYLNEYIQLNDSLLQKERSIRNKFARIEFETDQIKAENVQISKERLMFLLSSVGLLVTLVLLYVIISQRAKNKELQFSKMQQEANEEIYNLMLAQQDKIDEGRTQEKKRISEELHDGVLGRLFGTRLSLDSLNFVNTEDAIKTRSQYIDELKSIEQEIRKISHDLNTDFVSGSSFSDIIASYIETQTQVYNLTYDFHEDDEIDWDELSNKTKIHVYRMLQETMHNIYKHANAKHIKISFKLKNNVILVTVEDDGSGFNTNKARKGIGLKNFDSRAGEIGGKVEIFSNPGKGTKVNIHVPTE